MSYVFMQFIDGKNKQNYYFKPEILDRYESLLKTRFWIISN